MTLQAGQVLRAWRRAVTALAVLAMLGSAVSARAGEAVPSARVQALSSRYVLDDVRLQEGPDGVAGPFHLIGDLTPAALRTAAGAARQDPTVVARGVLRDLAPDLDLGEGEELRQDRLQTDDSGRSHLLFRRYVAGLRVDDLEVHIHFEPDGSVIAVQGVLVPVTEAMAEAAANAPTRPEKDEVAMLLRDDLVTLGTAMPQIRALEKILAAEPPYVVWKADVTAGDGLGRWLYRIDAATGEILGRQDTLEAAVPTLGEALAPPLEGPEKEAQSAPLSADPEKIGPRTVLRLGVKTALGEREKGIILAPGAAADSYALTPEAEEKKERP
jgi:hypothetical protein